MAQFNTGNNAFQAANKTLFEVNQIATANGSLVTTTNPFPVSGTIITSEEAGALYSFNNHATNINRG